MILLLSPVLALIYGLLALFYVSKEPLALIVPIVIIAIGYWLYRDTSTNDKEEMKKQRRMLGYDD